MSSYFKEVHLNGGREKCKDCWMPFFQFWHQLEQANLLAPFYIFGINKNISIVETLRHLFLKCLGKH